MAKRLSSMFSLGSNYSDQSSDSRLGSSIHPARPPKEQSNAVLTQKTTTDLRPSSNLQDLHNGHSSGLTPPFNPTLLPRIEDSDPFLQAPRLLAPVYPPRLDSPGGSRPSSRENRPENSEDFFSPPPLLKPLPTLPDSANASRPVSRDSRPGSRAPSRPTSQPPSRPASPTKFRPLTPTSETTKVSKRRSWLPGKSRPESQDGSDGFQMPQAWLVTPREKLQYDPSSLASFVKVQELWNENGDTLVYLHTRECGRGPSFKVDSSIFASSRKLVQAAYGGKQESRTQDARADDASQQAASEWQNRTFVERVQHLTVNGRKSPSDSRPSSSHGGSSKGSRSISDYVDEAAARKDIHLCLPLPLRADLSNPTAKPTSEDVETLVTMRNLFAFLLGLPLVATARQSSMFTILLKIADVMHRYEFTNLDGSTLGEDAAGSFKRCIEDFKLADLRSSREKTVEAIVLGERMRSWELYNEGFVHAVGKYEDISSMKSPKYHLIADSTRKRLERAHLDLGTRLLSIQTRLDDFDFPSLFAGIANSTTSSESKVVHFKDWKASYLSMRRHVMNLYKHRYGAWPPKARSKKNDFEESGLNRVLLRELYQDFSDLYDILADCSSLTTRSVDLPAQEDPNDPQDPAARALRRVLDEYDRSTPPIQPPVPFDVPRIPCLSDTRRDFDTLELKKQRKECTKKLRDDEINKALMQSYNRDSIRSTPFLEAFMSFERRSAHGKSIDEIADLRYGQWIFMYAVLQSLPLVVVDAPGVKWSKGVEYFLCEVPKGSAPWVQTESHGVQKSWYGVAGSSGLVSLPADVVEHGVDGIYRRSHCWQVAEKWAGYDAANSTALPYDDLLPPMMPSTPESRENSRRASMALGLEQLPMPQGVAPSGSRPVSVHDPSKTFGSILAQAEKPGTPGKKKK